MTSSSNASASMPSARTARVYGSGGPAAGSSGHSSPQRRQTSVAGPPSNGADLNILAQQAGQCGWQPRPLNAWSPIQGIVGSSFVVVRSTLTPAMPGNAGPVWSLPLSTVPGRMGAGMEVPELMTATQVARILGVSTETLRKWRAKRRCLPYVRVGRHIRYKAADVAAFVERGTVMPDGKHGRER